MKITNLFIKNTHQVRSHLKIAMSQEIKQNDAKCSIEVMWGHKTKTDAIAYDTAGHLGLRALSLQELCMIA